MKTRSRRSWLWHAGL